MYCGNLDQSESPATISPKVPVISHVFFWFCVLELEMTGL